MSARLDKFTSQTRIRVDQSLAQRWDWDASSHGEKNIKTQITQARRTATTLRKAIGQFANIRPEHELAINAAASAMDALAKELTPMVAWAKAYKAFCTKEYERERQDELESLAQSRWGDDAVALQFEVDLILELNTEDGRLAFAQWLHSVAEHTDVAIQKISPCVDRILEGETLRERMAATVKEHIRDTDTKWNARDGLTVICSWRSYERYLAHRKDIAKKTNGILKGFAA